MTAKRMLQRASTNRPIASRRLIPSSPITRLTEWWKTTKPTIKVTTKDAARSSRRATQRCGLHFHPGASWQCGENQNEKEPYRCGVFGLGRSERRKLVGDT